MKTWLSLALFAACLSSAGCRQDPYINAYFDAKNAELRHHEDRVYELEDEKQQLEDQLESARRENNKLRKMSGEEEDTTKPKRGSILPRSSSPPKTNGAKPPEDPMIDLGAPGEPGLGPQPKPARKRPDMNGVSKPNELPPPVEFEGEQTAYVEPEDPRVTHIILNPFLTGGHDFDHKPGDDGVSVIIEPRNKEDQFVQQAGPVSIVVIDPAIEGKESRIARWDFDSIEAGKLMKKKGFDRGIHLKLPWPNKPPDNNELQVFVRYQTLDGRKLEADRKFKIAMPGQFSQRWTPRPLDATTDRDPSGNAGSVLVGHLEEATDKLSPPPRKKPFSAADSPRRPTWQPNR